MKHLKIAIVTGQFPVVSETFIINQIAYLKQEGHDVDILCLGKKNTDFRSNRVVDHYNLINDAQLFRWQALMPINKINRFKKVVSILFSTRCTSIFVSLLVTFNPLRYGLQVLNCKAFFKLYYQHYFAIINYDLVHIHFADYAVQLLPQLHHFNNKVIVTFHGYDAHNFNAHFYKKLQSLKQIQYTVNTNFTKMKVLQLGFSESKITVLPMGLDTSFFRPKKVEHDVFTILFVGRLIEFKAPILAIKIIENLITTTGFNVHLNIIGSGSEYEACREYITCKNLDDYITLHHNKSQQEIKDFMNKADAFLFPGILDASGRCENQGLVLQEAQAMELPVIISDVGGMQEGMIPNQTGFVLKANDIDGFVDCLTKLIQDPVLKNKVGKAGRIFVAKYYDTKVLGKKLLKLYKE